MSIKQRVARLEKAARARVVSRQRGATVSSRAAGGFWWDEPSVDECLSAEGARCLRSLVAKARLAEEGPDGLESLSDDELNDLEILICKLARKPTSREKRLIEAAQVLSGNELDRLAVLDEQAERSVAECHEFLALEMKIKLQLYPEKVSDSDLRLFVQNHMGDGPQGSYGAPCEEQMMAPLRHGGARAVDDFLRRANQGWTQVPPSRALLPARSQ